MEFHLLRRHDDIERQRECTNFKADASQDKEELSTCNIESWPRKLVAKSRTSRFLLFRQTRLGRPWKYSVNGKECQYELQQLVSGEATANETTNNKD